MPKRVFFTFDNQDLVDQRADVVRQLWLARTGQGAVGFFDPVVWEHARQSGDTEIRRLIDSGLERTAVTCALIGSETYHSRWVRYAIMRSFRRGNALLAVHVNHIKGRDQGMKPIGPNPLAHLGISYAENGLTATLWETIGEEWQPYSELGGSATYETGGVLAQYWGKSFTLAQWYPEYNWVADDGPRNFEAWIG